MSTKLASVVARMAFTESGMNGAYAVSGKTARLRGLVHERLMQCILSVVLRPPWIPQASSRLQAELLPQEALNSQYCLLIHAPSVLPSPPSSVIMRYALTSLSCRGPPLVLTAF